MTQGQEFRRLLRYLSPYTWLLVIGVVLMAAMGIAEGLVPLAIAPAVDVVLNPQSALQKLVLFRVPGTDHILYMNDLVPSRVHHVWSVFALVCSLSFYLKLLRNILAAR